VGKGKGYFSEPPVRKRRNRGKEGRKVNRGKKWKRERGLLNQQLTSFPIDRYSYL
jgi:hypothetical protein